MGRNISIIILSVIILIVMLLTYGNYLNNDFLIDDIAFRLNIHSADFTSIKDFFIKTTGRHYAPVYYLMNITLFEYFDGINNSHFKTY